jgi:predicted ester cyclase
MSTPTLVEAFYSRIWNDGDLTATRDLLNPEFCFRGSLGLETQGRDAFDTYVRSVRGALTAYHCKILDCVAEGNKAFAKMRFSGVHVAPLRGFEPTGKPVHWLGAALFEFERDRIASLWVLGDLAGLDAVLQANSTAEA